jgi:pseudaminic acid biosynthesis-associated methylase
MKFKTEQEEFWAGDFGNDYIQRNKEDQLVANNLNLFTNALNKTQGLKTCIEFGANIGMNIKALRILFPSLNFTAVEINKTACKSLSSLIGFKNVHEKSILDFESKDHYDLTIIKTVLIHINPNELAKVYQSLYSCSKRYILIAEYFNPLPIEVNYRGHSGKLFKRDFAGEMMDKFQDLSLLDYGFCYNRDNNFPQDNINWFLLEKCN